MRKLYRITVADEAVAKKRRTKDYSTNEEYLAANADVHFTAGEDEEGAQGGSIGYLSKLNREQNTSIYANAYDILNLTWMLFPYAVPVSGDEIEKKYKKLWENYEDTGKAEEEALKKVSADEFKGTGTAYGTDEDEVSGAYTQLIDGERPFSGHDIDKIYGSAFGIAEKKEDYGQMVERFLKNEQLDSVPTKDASIDTQIFTHGAIFNPDGKEFAELYPWLMGSIANAGVVSVSNNYRAYMYGVMETVREAALVSKKTYRNSLENQRKYLDAVMSKLEEEKGNNDFKSYEEIAQKGFYKIPEPESQNGSNNYANVMQLLEERTGNKVPSDIKLADLKKAVKAYNASVDAMNERIRLATKERLNAESSRKWTNNYIEETSGRKQTGDVKEKYDWKDNFLSDYSKYLDRSLASADKYAAACDRTANLCARMMARYKSIYNANILKSSMRSWKNRPAAAQKPKNLTAEQEKATLEKRSAREKKRQEKEEKLRKWLQAYKQATDDFYQSVNLANAQLKQAGISKSIRVVNTDEQMKKRLSEIEKQINDEIRQNSINFAAKEAGGRTNADTVGSILTSLVITAMNATNEEYGSAFGQLKFKNGTSHALADYLKAKKIEDDHGNLIRTVWIVEDFLAPLKGGKLNKKCPLNQFIVYEDGGAGYKNEKGEQELKGASLKYRNENAKLVVARQYNDIAKMLLGGTNGGKDDVAIVMVGGDDDEGNNDELFVNKVKPNALSASKHIPELTGEGVQEPAAIHMGMVLERFSGILRKLTSQYAKALNGKHYKDEESINELCDELSKVALPLDRSELSKATAFHPSVRAKKVSNEMYRGPIDYDLEFLMPSNPETQELQAIIWHLYNTLGTTGVDSINNYLGKQFGVQYAKKKTKSGETKEVAVNPAPMRKELLEYAPRFECVIDGDDVYFQYSSAITVNMMVALLNKHGLNPTTLDYDLLTRYGIGVELPDIDISPVRNEQAPASEQPMTPEEA